MGIQVDFIDVTDLGLVEKSIKPNTKVFSVNINFLSRISNFSIQFAVDMD